jgi:hypothetical protein
MAEQAQVKSVEALESLRAAFVIYQTKARRAVDMALEEMTRLRQWIESDCRLHWEGQIRQWSRQLERARAELLTVRLSALVDRSSRHEEAVKKAERGLAHAQEKLKMAKRWARDFDTAVGPHVRRLENVRDSYVHNLPKAAAWLHQAELTLEAYAESRYASLTGDHALPAPPAAPLPNEPGSPP